MGSTDSGAGEFSVGSIVWVRRRNGSWWPGKIVGPEELSASHLTSPRSGTPVKLLGREDASVDWYNLEKSKRVKAFRCGEFDDCIERAESSQGMPIKKREKYARREDAILHALDLEKKQMRKQGKLASDGSNHKSGSYGFKKGLLTPSGTLRNKSVKPGNAKSNQISKKLDVSPKNEIFDSPVTSQKFKERNQFSGDEDHSDVVPRMRGLQDFGLKIVPSKATLSTFIASNGLRRPIVENSAEALPSGGSNIGSSSQMNGKNSLHKRKRLHEDLVRRREKRQPLVQVSQSNVKSEEAPDSVQPDSSVVSTSISGGLESVGAICRAKRSKCVYFPADSSESLDYKAVSHSDIEMSDSQNVTDTSETDSSESDTDSSETEDEEMGALSDSVPTESELGSMGRQEAHDNLNEVMLSSDMSHFYTRYPSSAHEAVSKWQLKGKRNIRNLTKRSVDAKALAYGAYTEEKDFRGELIGMDNRYFSSRSAFKSRNLVEWDDWSSEDRRVQYGGKSRSILIDVEIKVQASYQKAPVPLVSLMSKLNGHAVIGHPIQVEALEDGSSSDLIPARDDFGNEAIENDGNTPLPHAWRTARRTANVRVPRPQPSSNHDGDEAYGFPKSNFGNFGGFGKGTLVRKNAPHGPDRKYKKSQKKVSATSSSSQKTRTLSSIAIEHKLGSNKRNHTSSYSHIDGTVKRESVGPTTVACIPVKLVFSRLLEKINRPESTLGSHCTL